MCLLFRDMRVLLWGSGRKGFGGLEREVQGRADRDEAGTTMLALPCWSLVVRGRVVQLRVEILLTALMTRDLPREPDVLVCSDIEHLDAPMFKLSL